MTRGEPAFVPAEGGRLEPNVYDAFISYRHVEPDSTWARWLHSSLEAYRVPRVLVRDQRVPSRLSRVFRDQDELQASADLSAEIDAALRRSRFLIVICSPDAASSRWVGAEIRRFQEVVGPDRVLALLVRGEPEDAFPAALRRVQRLAPGEAGEAAAPAAGVEPLAADVRPQGHLRTSEVRRTALLRILSILLGCRFDDLKRRHLERRRRFQWTAGAAVGAVVLAFLGIAAFGIHQAVRRAESDAYAAMARERERQRFENAIRDVTQSVHMIGLSAPGGTYLVTRSTACVVAPGVLATAAHVVVEDLQRPPGWSIVARTNAGPPRDVPVREVTVHPGYAAFAEAATDLDPIDPDTGRSSGWWRNPCDVALLTVAPEDAALLGAPLRLASSEEIAGSERGGEVAMLGFPVDLLCGDRCLPMAQRGTLAGVCDVVGSLAPAEEVAPNLVFEISARPGTSGSPVFGRRGEVLAIACSVGGAGHGRFGGARLLYGPRAERVQDLLDGVADAFVAAERPAWERTLRARMDRSAREYAEVTRFVVTSGLLEGQPAGTSIRTDTLLEARGIVPAGTGDEASTHGVAVPRAGALLAVVVADRETDIDVSLSSGRGPASGTERDADDERRATFVYHPVDDAGEARVSVRTRHPVEVPVPYSVRVFHLTSDR